MVISYPTNGKPFLSDIMGISFSDWMSLKYIVDESNGYEFCMLKLFHSHRDYIFYCKDVMHLNFFPLLSSTMYFNDIQSEKELYSGS
jgi:hypothetical protein